MHSDQHLHKAGGMRSEPRVSGDCVLFFCICVAQDKQQKAGKGLTHSPALSSSSFRKRKMSLLMWNMTRPLVMYCTVRGKGRGRVSREGWGREGQGGGH